MDRAKWTTLSREEEADSGAEGARVPWQHDALAVTNRLTVLYVALTVLYVALTVLYVT